MTKSIKIILFVLICQLVGLLGTPFTIQAIPTWYATLNKPFFSPPNWIFGPVWTILYTLMGISAYLVWTKVKSNKKAKTALKFFGIQLILNFLWSLFFFGLYNPLLGLIDIICLWVAIIINIRVFYPLSRLASYLLIPYIFWVTYAMILNLFIVFLN